MLFLPIDEKNGVVAYKMWRGTKKCVFYQKNRVVAKKCFIQTILIKRFTF